MLSVITRKLLNYLAFASDESYFLLCSLEVLDDEGNFKRKADMFSKRTIKPHRAVTSVETASEALAISIGEKARVDLPFMAELTGKEQAELIRDLQGVIFKIPHSEPAKYVTADEYLSGKGLYSQSRKLDGKEKEAVKAQISDISKRLGEIRKEVRLCEGITARSDTLKEKLQAVRADEKETKRKELMKNEYRRRCGGTNRENEFRGI